MPSTGREPASWDVRVVPFEDVGLVVSLEWLMSVEVETAFV